MPSISLGKDSGDNLMNIQLTLHCPDPNDQQKLKNFQALLKTLAMQRCKLSQLIIPTWQV